MSDLSPGSVEPLLHGRLGHPYRFVEECASTQRLLDDDAAEGTTVATDLQTHGRGRLGRRWEAPAGRALLFSVLLNPTPPMALWPELSLVAGDAVAAALREEAGVVAELSHPNDVLIYGRKVAGILPEATAGRVVLGVGVNVNQTAEELPAETPKPSTSLRIETGREWPRAPLLAAMLLALERGYDAWQRLHTNR
ncbi:MAG TPA: biotin--[acetyl-CoA-carboxylase] ligase [Gaiellaceae bacterium]|nr:biotin--[acetyl-CoA-carboxylase] ligase [Gaiellaceae bacterium]